MNYRRVQQLQQKAIAVQHSCRVLELSRSGYYIAQHRAQRPQAVCPITVQLQSAFEASGHCYGRRCLQGVLNAQSIRIGRYRLRSLMRDHQFKPVWQR